MWAMFPNMIEHLSKTAKKISSLGKFTLDFVLFRQDDALVDIYYLKDYNKKIKKTKIEKQKRTTTTITMKTLIKNKKSLRIFFIDKIESDGKVH